MENEIIYTQKENIIGVLIFLFIVFSGFVMVMFLYFIVYNILGSDGKIEWDELEKIMNAYCVIFPFVGLGFFWFGYHEIPFLVFIWCGVVWILGAWYYVKRYKRNRKTRA